MPNPMWAHLFINACALGFGLLIGFMEAEEKYKKEPPMALSDKKQLQLKNIVEHMKNLALENMETEFYEQSNTRKDFTEMASLAESAEGILYGKT